MYLDHTFGLKLLLSELAQRKLRQRVTSPSMVSTATEILMVMFAWSVD